MLYKQLKLEKSTHILNKNKRKNQCCPTPNSTTALRPTPFGATRFMTRTRRRCDVSAKPLARPSDPHPRRIQKSPSPALRSARSMAGGARWRRGTTLRSPLSPTPKFAHIIAGESHFRRRWRNRRPRFDLQRNQRPSNFQSHTHTHHQISGPN